MKLKIICGQLEITPGRPDVNYKKIIDAIEKARSDEEAASLITTEQLTVLAGKGGVVFAHASVLVELACFDGDAAEHDADVLAVQCDLLRIIFAVIKKALLLPKVTDEIAGQRHLGQQQDVRLAAARFVYSLYDFMIV